MDQDQHDYLTEILAHDAERVAKAEEAVALAERTRRINAAYAIRCGYEKTAASAELGISRPTLDAWIARVESTPDEAAELDQRAKFEARADAKAARRG